MAKNSSSKRGFAAMEVEERVIIARKGGKASHEKGHAHEFTPEEAREAGKKGGRKSHERMDERDMRDMDRY